MAVAFLAAIGPAIRSWVCGSQSTTECDQSIAALNLIIALVATLLSVAAVVLAFFSTKYAVRAVVEARKSSNWERTSHRLGLLGRLIPKLEQAQLEATVAQDNPGALPGFVDSQAPLKETLSELPKAYLPKTYAYAATEDPTVAYGLYSAARNEVDTFQANEEARLRRLEQD